MKRTLSLIIREASDITMEEKDGRLTLNVLTKPGDSIWTFC
jgi:hypothetical protein